MTETGSFSILATCPACGKKNRIPAGHLTHAGRCGSCKATLQPVGHPIDATTNSFDEILRSVNVPVLVDFWADWCGPCRMAAPEVHKLAETMAGKALVLKVDTEAEPTLAARYGIQSIPNFVVFRDGRQVFQRAGVASSTEMRRWLESPMPR